MPGIADRFAHDIVTFMRSWAPYGGPPADEVLPEFGLTLDQLVQRYDEIQAAAVARRMQHSARREADRRAARSAARPTPGSGPAR
jgi:hypothetical protein